MVLDLVEGAVMMKGVMTVGLEAVVTVVVREGKGTKAVVEMLVEEAAEVAVAQPLPARPRATGCVPSCQKHTTWRRRQRRRTHGRNTPQLQGSTCCTGAPPTPVDFRHHTQVPEE